MGVYAMDPSLLELIPQHTHFGFDDLVLKMLEIGLVARAHSFHGTWMDIGRPEDFHAAWETRSLPSTKAWFIARENPRLPLWHGATCAGQYRRNWRAVVRGLIPTRRDHEFPMPHQNFQESPGEVPRLPRASDSASGQALVQIPILGQYTASHILKLGVRSRKQVAEDGSGEIFRRKSKTFSLGTQLVSLGRRELDGEPHGPYCSAWHAV